MQAVYLSAFDWSKYLCVCVCVCGIICLVQEPVCILSAMSLFNACLSLSICVCVCALEIGSGVDLKVKNSLCSRDVEIPTKYCNVQT